MTCLVFSDFSSFASSTTTTTTTTTVAPEEEEGGASFDDVRRIIQVQLVDVLIFLKVENLAFLHHEIFHGINNIQSEHIKLKV
jgi:hypothetical protein